MRLRVPSESGVSRARSTCESRTTPRAPPARHAADVFAPIPPRTQNGTFNSRLSANWRHFWSSTNDVSAPTRPPASWPFRITPSAPSSTAFAASDTLTASRRTSTPAAFRARTRSARAGWSAPARITRAGLNCGRRLKYVSASIRSCTPKVMLANRASRASAAGTEAVGPNSRSNTPLAPARQAAMARDGSAAPVGDKTMRSRGSITRLEGQDLLSGN